MYPSGALAGFQHSPGLMQHPRVSPPPATFTYEGTCKPSSTLTKVCTEHSHHASVLACALLSRFPWLLVEASIASILMLRLWQHFATFSRFRCGCWPYVALMHVSGANQWLPWIA